ncbi:MAG: ATP-binding protein [Candidatus Omnitrophica bacterium]|nr:ATP-binding protein [Candidatus Omnitrophota bacterium]MDD5440648.1 ATP-binding protein [Candidatus Omnitrophota bacterium]
MFIQKIFFNSIFKKFFFGFIVILILFGLVGFFDYLNISSLRNISRQAIFYNNQASSLYEMSISLETLESKIDNFFEFRYLTYYEEAFNEIENMETRIKRLSQDLGAYGVTGLGECEDNFSDLKKMIEGVGKINYMLSTSREVNTQVILVYDQINKVKKSVRYLLDGIQKMLIKNKTALEELVFRVVSRQVAIVFFIMAIGIFVALFVAKTIVKPILVLNKAALQIAKGDLSKDVDVSAKDEIGDLGRAFNSMLNHLRNSTTSIENLYKEIDKHKETQEELEKKNIEMRVTNKYLADNERAIKNMFADIKEANDELKRAQNQLIQSEKLASIGQLSAGVAHEINNPLGFVNSNLSTLDKYVRSLERILIELDSLQTSVKNGDVAEAQRIEEQIAHIEDELDIQYIMKDIHNLLKESQDGLDRIKKIVMDLKTFSRRDEKVKTMEDINKVIDGVINIVWNEIKYKAELEKEYGDIPKIECNPQQLGQVFINLLTNAVQAMDNRGKITVRTHIKDRNVYVDVIDTGRGMSPEIAKNIFEPFFTTKKSGVGTGLGLSLSYDIIKAHKGHITVDSTVGKGTKFTVIIPV